MMQDGSNIFKKDQNGSKWKIEKLTMLVIIHGTSIRPPALGGSGAVATWAQDGKTRGHSMGQSGYLATTGYNMMQQVETHKS